MPGLCGVDETSAGRLEFKGCLGNGFVFRNSKRSRLFRYVIITAVRTSLPSQSVVATWMVMLLPISRESLPLFHFLLPFFFTSALLLSKARSSPLVFGVFAGVLSVSFRRRSLWFTVHRFRLLFK